MFDIKELIKKKFSEFLNLFSLLKNERALDIEMQSKIAKIIISSSDPEELKNKVTREIAVVLNASRCYFIEYDLTKNIFKKISNAYSTQREDLSIFGFDIESLKNLSIKLKYMDSIVIEDTEKLNNPENKTGEYYFFKTYNVKSFLAVRLQFGEDFSGVLVVDYKKKKPFLKRNDLLFLKKISEHISIALYLSKLYVAEKTEKERELLLRSINTITSESHDLTNITKKISEIFASLYKARYMFVNIDIENLKNLYSYNFSKNKTEKMNTVNKDDLMKIYNLPVFEAIKNKIHYIEDTHHFIISKNLENSEIEDFFIKNRIKSLLLLPILYEYNSYGIIIIHFDRTSAINSGDLEFIKLVNNQLAIAIVQANIYQNEKITADREILLQKIIKRIRSSLNFDQTLTIITNQLAKLFNTDRIAVIEFVNEENMNEVRIRKEYKIREEIKSPQNIAGYKEVTAFIAKQFLEFQDPVIINNIETSDFPDFVKAFYRIMEIKSVLWLPIMSKNNLWGAISLSQIDELKNWTAKEINLLKDVTSQIYTAIYQSELYEKTKLIAERERINRNIVEILRSSMDQKVIKSQFVKNIGKLFGANRVFIAEYDSNKKTFLPTDKNSEYLSSIEEKSVVDQAISSTDDYIKPILEKREFLTYDWQKYVENTPRSEEFTALFEDYKIKSRYSFPILHNHNMFGFFCIEFTKEIHELSEEDINRIRNICTQAGIAMYQASLFEKVQNEVCLKRGVIDKVATKARSILNDIMDLSESMSNTDEKCEKHFEYLNKVDDHIKLLLELTNQLIEHSHNDSDEEIK